MGALFDMAADLVDMELHGLGIGKRQCESRPGTTVLGRWRRTDRRSCSAGRPAVAAACRVWPTAVQSRSSGRSLIRPGTRSPPSCAAASRKDAPSACEASFFEFLDEMGILRGMTRSHTHVGEAELVQQLPDIARVIINAEAVLDGFLQSIRRQRTTPSTARSGPFSTSAASSACCSCDSRDAGPGAH